TVEWLKDGLEGDEIHSRLRVVDVGTDEDGDPETSCVVEPADAPQLDRRSGLTRNQQTMLDILIDAGKGGLSVEEWNERGRAAGIGTKRSADLYDIRLKLKERKAIYAFNDRWYVQT